jgi:hypothetical protein
VKFASCNGSGDVVVSGIPNVGGLALDQNDTLFYINSVTSGSVLAGIYKCSGSSCSAFSTNQTLKKSVYVQPTNMNFDYHGKNLWVADPSANLIDEINSQNGSLEYQYSSSASDPPFGIAPEPG